MTSCFAKSKRRLQNGFLMRVCTPAAKALLWSISVSLHKLIKATFVFSVCLSYTLPHMSLVSFAVLCFVVEVIPFHLKMSISLMNRNRDFSGLPVRWCSGWSVRFAVDRPRVHFLS